VKVVILFRLEAHTEFLVGTGFGCGNERDDYKDVTLRSVDFDQRRCWA
jgi:hypothetical protein